MLFRIGSPGDEGEVLVTKGLWGGEVPVLKTTGFSSVRG